MVSGVILEQSSSLMVTLWTVVVTLVAAIALLNLQVHGKGLGRLGTARERV